MKLFLFLSLFTFSCARPTYINENSENYQYVQETKLDCSSVFVNSGLCLAWYWEHKPSPQQAGSLIFKTFRLNNFDQTPIEIDPDFSSYLVLWMPSMNHGSSPTTIEKLDLGTFRANNVFFVMPGEWELRFQLKDGSTIKDEIKIPITI